MEPFGRAFRSANDGPSARNGRQTGGSEGENVPHKPAFVVHDDAPLKQTEWIWRRRVPVGHVTALLGPRSSGKSFVALDIAAHVTRGLPWPDESEPPRTPGSVLLVATEDDHAKVICPRLRKAGADLSKVFLAKYPQFKLLNPEPFGRADIDAWEKIADSLPDLRLIVVDPFASLLGKANDSRTLELRDILHRIRHVARQRSLAVLLVNATDKVSAGKCWPHGRDVLPHVQAFARTLWELQVDRGNQERRLLLPTRVTLTADPGGLSFMIDPAMGRIVWDPSPVAMAEYRAPAPRRSVREVERAMAWLAEFLGHGSKAAQEVLRQGAIAGHSNRSIYFAKQRLAVSSRKSSEGAAATWMWELRSQQQPGTAEQGAREDSKITGPENQRREVARPVSVRPFGADWFDDSKISGSVINAQALGDGVPVEVELVRTERPEFEDPKIPFFETSPHGRISDLPPSLASLATGMIEWCMGQVEDVDLTDEPADASEAQDDRPG